MARAIWTWRPLPHGCSGTRIVTKSSPKPIPGATEGFPKKSGPRSKYTHGGHNTWDPRHGLGGKEVLPPPPPHPHPHPPLKKGYPGAGGYGGQNPKNHWGIIFGPKMMILQGVKR